LYTKLTVARVALGVKVTTVSPLPPEVTEKVPKVPPEVVTILEPAPVSEAMVILAQTTFVELSVAITVRSPILTGPVQLRRSTGTAVVTDLVAE
jgi:hypothetical protein